MRRRKLLHSTSSERWQNEAIKVAKTLFLASSSRRHSRRRRRSLFQLSATRSFPPRRENLKSPFRRSKRPFCGSEALGQGRHKNIAKCFLLHLQFISERDIWRFPRIWVYLVLTSDWEPMGKRQCVTRREVLDVDSMFSKLNTSFTPSYVSLVIS